MQDGPAKFLLPPGCSAYPVYPALPFQPFPPPLPILPSLPLPPSCHFLPTFDRRAVSIVASASAFTRYPAFKFFSVASFTFATYASCVG